MAQRSGFSVWVPTLSMLLVSVISYVDRHTLALLAPTILKDTGLTGEQYGFIISAFSITYMIGNPVWGRLLDRYGVRFGMLAAVGFWTVASVSHAAARGFIGFAAARAALGFGEGATFPGGLRTVVQTLPASQRSRGVAVAYSGGSMGAIITPLIVTPIALWWGWRAAFLFTGFIGLAWLAIWLVVSRRPGIRESPGREDLEGRPESKGDRLHWKDTRVWSFMAAYAMGGLPLAFVLYGAAIYLNQEMGKSQALIGKVLWIPPLGWELGYFFWGWLADRTPLSRKPSSAFRFHMAALALLSLPLAASPWHGSFPLLMAQLFFAMFVAAGFIILSVAYATRTYSGSSSGLIAGLGAGAWSALVALVMPYFGRLFDLHRYDTAFLIAAVFPIAGSAAWLALDRAHKHRAQPVPAVQGKL